MIPIKFVLEIFLKFELKCFKKFALMKVNKKPKVCGVDSNYNT